MKKRFRQSILESWTFTLWLTFQQNRRDAVGDLARLIAQDVVWPGHRDRAGLQDYLKEKGAPQSTLDALEKAWEE
jgi:uncharacterized protein YozE (UPF0346 family)